MHGAFIPDAPMKSYFLFLDDKGDECKYTLEDMIGDEELIFRNSHLFWAGACKLGMSAVTDGKDIIGLVRTLIQKGVPSVVMGLTNLDDRATARLLDNFCQVYDGNNKAKGLSEAIRQLRKCTLCDHAKKSGDSIDELKQYFNAQSDEFVFDNPYFWMPFVLYGDFR
ncbi:MAG: hypothetical protein MAG551_00677 [Candidatus Scalindua arabica]|uniref:CHAT domain-containing protein n=1 Tax=Candidatus Scalindua arabica TaxID=1127984 RepID=A0A941W1R2_9BACT|nr:hypothetical protein [Candidatus Scalindua arabica]